MASREGYNIWLKGVADWFEQTAAIENPNAVEKKKQTWWKGTSDITFSQELIKSN